MSKPASDTCPTCGGAMRKRGKRSVCPRCLLAGAVEESASEVSADVPPRRIAAPGIAELQPSFPELELRRLVGVGGMGAVYEAEQKALERVVALKLLRLETMNPEFAERFRREAKLLAQLDHPHIVRVHDRGERDGWAFLVMEFIRGTDLCRLLEHGRLERRQFLEIADSICAALAYAHAQGIVHRDIKPANVLLNGQGAVKIADFGLAKLADDQHLSLTSGGSSMGTPLYMAPEQRKSSADADCRADIYSTGIVLYEMLTGELPVGRVKPPSELADNPKALDKVVLKAIEPAPEDRFATAEELRAAIARAGRPASPRWPWVAAGFGIVGALAWAVWAPGTGEEPRSGTPPPDAPATPELIAVSVSDQTPQLSAPEPQAAGFFGSIIEAERDILVVGYGKVEPLGPSAAPSGEVYVYQSDADQNLGEPAILTAARPEFGDQFGRYVNITPDAGSIAVASAVKLAPEVEGEPAGGAIHIFERRDPDANEWRMAAEFPLPRSFTDGTFAMRVSAGPDLFIIGSPHRDDLGAARIYRREGGRWRYDAELTATEADGRSNFGVIAAAGPGQLAIAAPSARGDFLSQGKVVCYLREADGWRRTGEFSALEPSTWGLFGNELRRSGDILAVASTGSALGGVIGAGGVTLYQRDATLAEAWRLSEVLRAPVPEPQRIGYGGRMDLTEDWLLAMTLQAKDGGKRHSVIYIARRKPEGWRHIGLISGASDGEEWLGRAVFGDGFIACGHPMADLQGKQDAGVVYLFTKKLFQSPNRGQD